MDHRAPPVDHRPLDVDRARRRGVDRHPHRRHVVALAHLGRELEHPHEHGRHPLAVRGAVALDRRQRALGVEPLHHHDGAAERLDQRREAQRRGVVERRGGEVDGLRRRSRRGRRRGSRLSGSSIAPLRHRRPHALRPPGGARGVEHHRARGLVGERGVGHAVERGVVVGEALDGRRRRPAGARPRAPPRRRPRRAGPATRRRPAPWRRSRARCRRPRPAVRWWLTAVSTRPHRSAAQYTSNRRAELSASSAMPSPGARPWSTSHRASRAEPLSRSPWLTVSPGARHDHGRVVGVRRRTRSGKHAGMSTGSPGVVETVTLDGQVGRQAAWTSPAP